MESFGLSACKSNMSPSGAAFSLPSKAVPLRMPYSVSSSLALQIGYSLLSRSIWALLERSSRPTPDIYQKESGWEL